MSPIKGPHNGSHPGEVESSARTSWSRRRAWHGETVKIFVEAEYAKSNPPVEVTVLGKDSAKVDTAGAATLSDYSAGYSYDLKWKGKPYGDAREFKLQAKVDGKLTSDPSPALYVDLDIPSFSS